VTEPTFIWITIFCAIATYLTRFPSLLAGRALRITPRLKQGLSDIPIGVFAAMVAPVVARGALNHGHPNWPLLVATGAALYVAIRTRNPLWTMLVGVICIAVMRAL